MRLGSAFAWLLALLLGSLAGVLMYASLRVPQPTEVRPIRVWQDSPAGDHVAGSGNRLERGVSELGRVAATQWDDGDGGGALDRDGGGAAPDRDDGSSGGDAVDPDGDGHVGESRDRADDSGAGGAAPAPDDALDRDEVQGRGGDSDEPRDGDGGGD